MKKMKIQKLVALIIVLGIVISFAAMPLSYLLEK